MTSGAAILAANHVTNFDVFPLQFAFARAMPEEIRGGTVRLYNVNAMEETEGSHGF